MALTAFFSWQVDRREGGERRLIERALSDALRRIVSDATVEAAIREEGIEVDRDTKGVGGTPPIVDTIFKKIDHAAIFVPDLTFVCTRADGRPSPNPNVLIEYGWALKTLTHTRLMPVMNTYYGEPTAETMPFDMRHLRYPIRFSLPPEADAEQARTVRDKLSSELAAAIRTMITSPEFAERLPKPALFPAREPMAGKARFRPAPAPLGMTYPFLRNASREISLATGSAMWLRLMPIAKQNREWSTAALKEAAFRPNKILMPLGAVGASVSLSRLRGDDGFGVFMPLADGEPAPTVVYIFHTGEIWSVDTYLPNAADGGFFLGIPQFTGALDQYAAFLKDELGIKPPYRCIAGLEGVRNRPVWLPTKPGRMHLHGAFGPCVSNKITDDVVHEAGANSTATLRRFFEKVLDACGYEDFSILD